jgi:hypothetical protein
MAIAAAAADPVFPPGLRIGLAPPPGMSVSKRFPGFEDADNKVAITLLELPLPAYDNVEKSIFGNVPPGLTVEKREMFPFHDGIGFLLTGTIQSDGVTLHKWFLLARSIGGVNFDLTALVNAEVPEKARAIYTDTIMREALASVTLRPPPLAEQVGMLPFKLGDLAGFRPIQAMAVGGLIITDGPTDDISRQPYMIVNVGSGAPAAPDDRARIARDMLASAPLSNLVITSTEAMRIGGNPGFEIRATAKDMHGDPVKLVQWLRFGAGGYLRIIGVGRADDWDRLFNRFRAVRDGIELR